MIVADKWKQISREAGELYFRKSEKKGGHIYTPGIL